MSPNVINTVSLSSVFGYRYKVLDTPNGLWKRICKRFNVKVRCDDYCPTDCKYVLRDVVIKKRDLDLFRTVSNVVTAEMHKLGLMSYETCCKEVAERTNRQRIGE